MDKVAFTGSAAAGREVMAASARTLKRVTLELGGKSPAILFADAEFEPAIRGALFGVFMNQGEVCSATSRILVERSIYPRVVDAMVERAKTIRLGPGLDRDTRMGPLVSEAQFTRVRQFQELGKQEARLALGAGAGVRRIARRRLLRRADHLLRRRPQRDHCPRRDLRSGRVRHALRR